MTATQQAYYRELGRALRQARERRAISRRHVADALGVGEMYIGNCERGEKPLSALRISEWVNCLGDMVLMIEPGRTRLFDEYASG